MSQHRLKWPKIAVAGFALAIAAGTALAQREAPRESEDGAYREGYRSGFDDGYAQGYRKGLEDGRPVVVAPPPPRPRHPIVISRATYGAGPKRCDASRAVGNIANGQETASIEASNDLCGDPARDQKKRLEVSYVCGRVAKTAFANERDSVYLDCR
jgi:hypothetical protein